MFVRPVCDVLSCMGRFFCREGKFLMSLLIKELYEKQIEQVISNGQQDFV